MVYPDIHIDSGFYYAAFPNDQSLLKKIVLLLLVLETIQTTVFTQDIFRTFASGFNNLLLANDVGTLWFSVPLMTGFSKFERRSTLYSTENHVVALLTQLFYSYRIAVFTRSKSAISVTVMVRDKIVSLTNDLKYILPISFLLFNSEQL